MHARFYSRHDKSNSKFKLTVVYFSNTNVVQSIKDEAMGPYGQIVREIKTMAKDFQSVQFIHEAQGSNVDAHNLARSSLYKVLGLVFRSASRRV